MRHLIEVLEAHCNTSASCNVCPICRNLDGVQIIRRYGGECCFNEMQDSELMQLVDLFNKPSETPDEVNKASHYNQGGIECIKAIESSMSPEEYRGFLKGQVIKYVWRYRHKGTPSKDLKKARYYLDDMIRIMEDAEVKDSD